MQSSISGGKSSPSDSWAAASKFQKTSCTDSLFDSIVISPAEAFKYVSEVNFHIHISCTEASPQGFVPRPVSYRASIWIMRLSWQMPQVTRYPIRKSRPMNVGINLLRYKCLNMGLWIIFMIQVCRKKQYTQNTVVDTRRLQSPRNFGLIRNWVSFLPHLSSFKSEINPVETQGAVWTQLSLW